MLVPGEGHPDRHEHFLASQLGFLLDGLEQGFGAGMVQIFRSRQFLQEQAHHLGHRFFLQHGFRFRRLEIKGIGEVQGHLFRDFLPEFGLIPGSEDDLFQPFQLLPGLFSGHIAGFLHEGYGKGHIVLIRQLAHIVGIQPVQLLDVEHSRILGHVV